MVVDHDAGGFRVAADGEMERHRANRRSGPQRRRDARRSACRQSRPPTDPGFGSGAGLQSASANCRRVVEDLIDIGCDGLAPRTPPTSRAPMPPADVVQSSVSAGTAQPLYRAPTPPPPAAAIVPPAPPVADAPPYRAASPPRGPPCRPTAVCRPVSVRTLPAVAAPPPVAAVVPPPPPPVIVISDDDADDVIDPADSPVSAEEVAAIIRAAPMFSVADIFAEVRRRVPMSLGASRLLLGMLQAAAAVERRTLVELSSAAGVAVAADPSGQTAAQVVTHLVNSTLSRPR